MDVVKTCLDDDFANKAFLRCIMAEFGLRKVFLRIHAECSKYV